MGSSLAAAPPASDVSASLAAASSATFSLSASNSAVDAKDCSPPSSAAVCCHCRKLTLCVSVATSSLRSLNPSPRIAAASFSACSVACVFMPVMSASALLWSTRSCSCFASIMSRSASATVCSCARATSRASDSACSFLSSSSRAFCSAPRLMDSSSCDFVLSSASLIATAASAVCFVERAEAVSAMSVPSTWVERLSTRAPRRLICASCDAACCSCRSWRRSIRAFVCFAPSSSAATRPSRRRSCSSVRCCSEASRSIGTLMSSHVKKSLAPASASLASL
mmetsp:Transcript_49890/g.165177  ORF Transcript_49890/g.165177 Transcript_49890/m.165177 type:complete len:281 (+) Transcript_49890:762-1604(+)